MNGIHQISLKLQMGIHPAAEIRPEILRAMWWELLRERTGIAEASAVKDKGNSNRTTNPARHRAG